MLEAGKFMNCIPFEKQQLKDSKTMLAISQQVKLSLLMLTFGQFNQQD